MGKLQDITGNKYGRLTVECFAGNRGKRSLWSCVCECGNRITVMGDDLKSGHTKSCGCLHKDIMKEKYLHDLTGKRFGRLFVEELIGKNNRGYTWRCRCDCGNIKDIVGQDLKSGHVQSCGCYRNDLISQRSMIDMTGQKIGRLTVLERSGSNNQQSVVWKCQCECGNITYVPTVSLTHGLTRSCGCYKNEVTSKRSCKDLLGMKYGKLTVIGLTDGRKHGRQVWECLCECGNKCYVQTTDLLDGHIKTCGCVKSTSENRIAEYLDNNNIFYERQKKFIGCKNINYLLFDFYIPSMNLAIEYDGEQHYINIDFFGNQLEEQKRKDEIKTKYCEENDIVLVRIPYWEKDNIESILSDWLFLNDAEEAYSSSIDLSA